MRNLVLVCLVFGLTGCASAQYRPPAYRASAPAPPLPPTTGIVFAANGSGDFRHLSVNLTRAVAEQGAPLHVEAFAWSTGYGRYARDHVDHCNQLEQARRLALMVAAQRQACPGRKIYLIGHSAGCAVVLAAAEMLPPESVDRVVLLAPSVCVNYDLRLALRGTREGIDSFNSSEDRLVLGWGMKIVGTADDSTCRRAAGQYGFTPVIASPTDAALYCKLRQHPWSQSVAGSGNDGGHYGCINTGFLRAYVVPLLN